MQTNERAFRTPPVEFLDKLGVVVIWVEIALVLGDLHDRVTDVDRLAEIPSRSHNKCLGGLLVSIVQTCGVSTYDLHRQAEPLEKLVLILMQAVLCLNIHPPNQFRGEIINLRQRFSTSVLLYKNHEVQPLRIFRRGGAIPTSI